MLVHVRLIAMDTVPTLLVLLWFEYIFLHALFFSSVALTLWRCFVDNPSSLQRSRSAFRSGAAVHHGMVIDPVSGLVEPTAGPCRPTTKSVMLPLSIAVLTGYILYGP